MGYLNNSYFCNVLWIFCNLNDMNETDIMFNIKFKFKFNNNESHYLIAWLIIIIYVYNALCQSLQ